MRNNILHIIQINSNVIVVVVVSQNVAKLCKGKCLVIVLLHHHTHSIRLRQHLPKSFD